MSGKTGYIDNHKPVIGTSTEIIIFSFNGFYEDCLILDFYKMKNSGIGR